MKILYVAIKYNYGKPEQGYGFEHYNFYDALCKMNNAEHTVVYFPIDEIMQRIGKEAMNKQLLQTVTQEKPNLCFFMLFTEELFPETVREITEKSGTRTVNWFTDDHWRFDGYSRHWAPLFHWVATTDSQAPAKYKAIGYDHVIKTQWACNHFLYKPITQLPITNYLHSVSFVGQPHGNRKQVANQVMKAGIALECFGNGWPNGRVTQEQMISIFSQSKINLSLTKASTLIWTPKGLGHMVAKKTGEWKIGKWNLPILALQSPQDIVANTKRSLGQQREQIKGRNFEVPGCGGFLLTGDADNLRDYYEDGKEIVIFKNTADMIEKITYYLAHDKEREAIAQAGYDRTIREHTYEKRFNEIFKTMGLYGK